MNYLKIKIEPVGCKKIHPQLEKAFISFMLAGGWVLRVNRDSGMMTFYSVDARGKKRSFKIKKGNDMGELARERYSTFLKMYLIKGQQFLRDLENQLSNIKQVA